MTWTPKDVENRLREAYDTLRKLPDVEMRYLRNALRSRLPEIVETTASQFVSALAHLEQEGKLPDTKVKPAVPSGIEIDYMENALLGIPKRHLNLHNDKPWLNYLNRKRARMVWRRIEGQRWYVIAGYENRTERTCRRWFKEAMQIIADELVTVNAERRAR